MTDAERRAFLEEQRVVTVATNGRDGFPHLMPLWYALDGDDVLAWTFEKSQKAKNLQRDPRATLSVESGERYDELRGVVLSCEVEVDPDALEHGLAVLKRYTGQSSEDVVRSQAPKRVGLRFRPVKIASFDHRKLGE